MTKPWKDRITGGILVIVTSVIIFLFQEWRHKEDQEKNELQEKFKSDLKAEFKEEIKPELERKLDKEEFENYKESENKKDEMILNILRDIQEKQNQQIKRTDDILINISKIK